MLSSVRRHSLLMAALVMQRLLLCSSCVEVGNSSASTGGSDNSLLLVRSRLMGSLLSSGAGDCQDVRHCTADAAPASAAARRDAAALTRAGSWPDVDYGDRTRTGGWAPHVHLDRMVNMAAVVRAANGSSSSLVEPTRRAIQFWLKTDPRSDNCKLGQHNVFVSNPPFPSRFVPACCWATESPTRQGGGMSCGCRAASRMRRCFSSPGSAAPTC